MKDYGFRILLIDAPETDAGWFNGNVASPALAYIASYVKNRFDVRILDLHVEKNPWITLKNTLLEYKPDLIGMTFVHTCHHSEINACLEIIRKLHPETPVTGGGYVFSSLHEKYLKSGLADIVVIGEGEITFLEISKKLSTIKREKGPAAFLKQAIARGCLDGIKGLAYEGRDKVIRKTPPRPYINDIDAIPFPSFELFPMEKYTLPIYGGKETFGAMFSRGCANKCSFCTESAAWNHTVRRHSPEYAIKYLKILYEVYGRRTFIFGDTDFLSSREWVKGFIECLRASGMKINFFVQACCKSVLKCEDLLGELRELGLFEMMLGAESPFADVLNKLNKTGQSENLIQKAMKAVKSHGVILLVMSIWGTEFDTEETLKKQLDFFGKYADFISPGVITPYPGTSLAEEMRSNGVVMNEDLSIYDQMHVILPAGKLNYNETINVYHKNLFLYYNLNPRYYFRLFSGNKFLRRNQYYFLAHVWRSFFKELFTLGRGHLAKRLICLDEYQKVAAGM
ncbi:MAG TPA: radical SAM protein [Candidatus Wallbacteria bacterium]|nr:radical SAM protein [Candidatus Wallbacteria bacterium]